MLLAVFGLFIVMSGPAEPVQLVRPWPDQLLNFVAFLKKIQNKTVNFLEPKAYTIKRRPLLTGK